MDYSSVVSPEQVLIGASFSSGHQTGEAETTVIPSSVTVIVAVGKA